MAQHYHTTNNPPPPGPYGQPVEHPPPLPGPYGQPVEHPLLPPAQYGQPVKHPLPPPAQYGQPFEHPPLLPGPYGHYEPNPSMSSSRSDIGSYNTADYYQTGVLFTQMVHQLAEDNTRSNLSTALESARARNLATMLPIAWEENYPESVGIREDVYRLVCGESFCCATVMPDIKIGANNVELANIVSQGTQMILHASMMQEADATAFPRSECKKNLLKSQLSTDLRCCSCLYFVG